MASTRIPPQPRSGGRCASAASSRAAWRACELAGTAGDIPGPAKFYATAALGSGPGLVSTEIDAGAYFGPKLAAMRAHATQITVNGTGYALSNGIPRQASGTEYFNLLAGAGVREDDLFAQ